MARPHFIGRMIRNTAFLILALCPMTLMADTLNYQLNGKIYNKFMYANDGSQGCVWFGNPAWPDNIAGSTGACSELELNFEANVSKYVRMGARLKTRWGAVWQEWWENGDMKIEDGSPINFPGDTSAESLGMNHAMYMKVRGLWIEASPPIPTVRSVRWGSSDLGMFNAWTIGKIRYTERDNARGMFLLGAFDSIPLEYEGAIIALPKLWGGPSWNIGNDDPTLTNPFATEDYAYALRLDSQPADLLGLTGIVSYTRDVEFNLEDPDATGTINSLGTKDGAVDRIPRYQSVNATIEAKSDPLDVLSVNAFAAFSRSMVNVDYTFNGVESAQGFTPVVYSDKPVDGFAAKLRADAMDPFEIGLSLTVEYFDIGSDYNAILGARRESDVLLTDGFMEGGQLPTLNVANEFMDWDEPWFETVIGWHGITGLLTQNLDMTELKGEFTYLTYNTNMQGRDVDHMYPGFLYPDGYTDVDFFDPANTSDRGRDPRSVYRENEERNTQIAALWWDTFFDVGNGLKFSGKGKYIRDRDLRSTSYDNDDYSGDIYTLRGQLGYRLNNELSAFIGDEWNHWLEMNRYPLTSDLASGYFDYVTRKNKLFAGMEYNFAGMKLKYLIEWVIKDQERYNLDATATGFDDLDLGVGSLIPHLDNPQAYKTFNRVRAKAALEASW